MWKAKKFAKWCKKRKKFAEWCEKRKNTSNGAKKSLWKQMVLDIKSCVNLSNNLCALEVKINPFLICWQKHLVPKYKSVMSSSWRSCSNQSLNSNHTEIDAGECDGTLVFWYTHTQCAWNGINRDEVKENTRKCRYLPEIFSFVFTCDLQAECSYGDCFWE